MNSRIMSQLQSHIQQEFLSTLQVSPMESTVPFVVENTITGQEELVFVSKCSPHLYAPVKGRDIFQPTKVHFTMYNEGKNLIVRFELLDIVLESEILHQQAKSFLSILLHQDKITLYIIDGHTYQLIWLTNSLPFKTIRFHYKEIFEMYDVI